MSDTYVIVTPSPGLRSSSAARKIFKRGWRRYTVTVYEVETGDRLYSYFAYLPPAVNTSALEHMLELWTK